MRSLSNQHSEKLDVAVAALDSIDTQRNLSLGIIIIVFFLSFSAGIASFFVFIDLLLWEGINDFIAAFLASASWVLIFPVWIITFLLVMATLQRLGFTALGNAAQNQLSDLAFTPSELDRLSAVLESKNYKHAAIFQKAINALTDV